MHTSADCKQRCLSIARSYALHSNPKNALALFVRASELASKCLPVCESSPNDEEGPLGLDVSGEQARALSTHLKQLVWQYRGIVEIEKLGSDVEDQETESSLPPLLERLNEYPPAGPDLSKLVTYPPKLEPIPVKPLFFDVAWNYIDYPREAKRTVDTREATTPTTEAKQQDGKKKGWFGFGI